jgi:hypothetical protein
MYVKSFYPIQSLFIVKHKYKEIQHADYGGKYKDRPSRYGFREEIDKTDALKKEIKLSQLKKSNL